MKKLDFIKDCAIGSYLGLVPSENSSGQSRHQGPITKAGNTYAHKLLIEAAWQHRRPYRKREHFDERHKVSVKANTAIAQPANVSLPLQSKND